MDFPALPTLAISLINEFKGANKSGPNDQMRNENEKTNKF